MPSRRSVPAAQPDSLERILRAAEALIKSKGYEALTAAEVVRRSHTSIGTLYARFGDKTALLHAVQERVQAREEAIMRARLAKVDWDALSLEETVRQAGRDQAGSPPRATIVCSRPLWSTGLPIPWCAQQGYSHKAQVEGLEIEILMRPRRPDRPFGPRAAPPGWLPGLARRPRKRYVQRSLSGVSLPTAASPDLLSAAVGRRDHRLSEEYPARRVAAGGVCLC